MKKLLKYLKDYRKECITAPLFKLLEACFELLVPLVVASVIDRGIGGADRSYLYQMFALLVLLGVVGLCCAIVAQYFSAKAAMGFSAKLRSALFSHIQSLSYSDLDHFGTSRLITRISGDVTQVQTGVNLTLRLIMRAPFVVFGAVILAFTVDVRCALIFCVTVPLLLIAVFAIMLGCVPLYKKVQGRLDAITAATRENLNGVRVIRAFAKEADEREAFAQKNNALCKVQRFTGKLSALLNPVTYATVNISIAVLIYTGALRVNMGALTQGEVVALYNYMTQILTELVKMATLIITMTKAFASAARINEVFETPCTMKNGNVRSFDSFDIVFDRVGLTYKGASAPSLREVSFTAKKGETIGVIGATGSGKSSLVHLIPRFYDVTEGVLTIGGRSVADYDTRALREKIGIVPQKAVLFHGSIRENILNGWTPVEDEEIRQALTAAQALDIVEKKEHGLDEEIEQGGRNLSGGQRQRLTIARALVRRPEILILDDSSPALDYATDAALRKSIAACPFRPTVFIVSQRASSVMHADKIIVLEDGEIAGIGTHDELMQRCAVYSEIYYSQFEKEGQGV